MAGKIPAGKIATDIELNGAQPKQTLTELRRSVTQVTQAWKAEQAELKATGKSVEAAEAKYKGLQKEVQEQANVIKKIKAEQAKLDTTTANGAEMYNKLGKQLVSATTKYNSLKVSQEKAKSSMEYYTSGLAKLQREYTTSTRYAADYAERLKAEGNGYKASEVKMDSYKSSLVNLTKQLKVQEDELQRIERESGKTSDAYKRQEDRVNKTGKSLADLKNEQKDVRQEFNKFHPTGFAKFDKSVVTLSKHTGKLKDIAKSVGASLKKVGLTASAVAVGITKVGIDGAKKAGDLQKTFTEDTNLLTTSGEKTKNVTKEIATMQRDGEKYSIKYAESQQNIAQGYQELVKRGYDGKQSLGAMQSILQASKASGDSFKDTLEVTTSTLEAFGMRTNSVSGMMKNTREVANKLAMAADATSTDFRSLGKGMNYVGTSAKVAGVSLTETASAMGVLSNSGLDAEQAGTGLRKVLNGLRTPTEDGEKLLKKYNIQVKDSSGKMRSLSDIFTDISKNVPKGKQVDFFHNVFGTTGQNAAAVLAQNTKELKHVNKQVEGAYANDYVSKLAKKNMKSTKNQQKQFHAAFEAIQLDIGEAMMPALSKASVALTKAFADPAVIKGLKKIASGIGDLAMKVADFLAWLGKGDHAANIAKIGKALLAAFASYKLIKGINTLKGTVTDFLDIFKLKPVGIKSAGKAVAEDYVSGIAENVVNSKGKIKFSSLFKYGTAAAKKGGKDSGLGWARSVAAKIGDKKVLGKGKWTKIFSPATTAAKEVGTKSGNGLIGKFLPVTKKGFGKAASIAALAFGAVDIFKGFSSKSNKSKAKAAGQTAGMTIGAGVGAFFGSPAMGAIIGKGVADWGPKIWSSIRHGSDSFVHWWQKTLIPSLRSGIDSITSSMNQFVKGLKNPKKGADSDNWYAQAGASFSNDPKIRDKANKAMRRGQDDFWNNVSGWLNGDYNSSKKKKKKKSSGVDQKVMASAMDVSKKSIKNVKNMSKALKDYAKALGTVKGTIKKNDPSKELNAVSDSLSKHEKTWARLSKDIKPIGDAFKNLATFAKSMAKVDVFKELTSDLPKLEKALGSHKKGIVKGINDLSKAFGTKEKGLYPRVKDITKVLDGLDTKLYHLNKKLNKTADDFKAIYKVTKEFSSKKNNPFENMAKGLDKLKDALKKDTKDIDKYIKQLTDTFAGKGKGKGKKKGLIDELKSLQKPLDKVTKDISTMSKNIKPVTAGFQAISKAVKQFSGKNTTKKNNPFTVMADGLGTLYKELKKHAGSIATNLTKISSSMGITTAPKKGSKKSSKKATTSYASVAKDLKGLNTQFKNLNKNTKPTAKRLGKVNTAAKKLSSSIKKLSKTIKKNKFGKQIADQIDEANDAFTKKGKKNFVTQLEKSFTDLEKSLKSFKKKFSSSWKDLWDDAAKAITKSMKKSKSNQDDGFKKLISAFGVSSKKFTSRFNSWTNKIEKAFKKVFTSSLPSYTKTGMNKMVATINKATSGVNSVIKDFGGNANVISKIHLATGTGYFGSQRKAITKPTMAVLNDGSDSPETGNREAIYRPRTGQIGIVQGVNVPALLSPGDEVFNATEAKMLGLTHFANGTGYLKTLFEKAKAFNAKPKATLDKIFNFADNAKGAMKSLVEGGFKETGKPAKSWWSTLWSMVDDKINDGGGASSALLKAVEKYGEGHQYHLGAKGPDLFDCSGLVEYALRKSFGIALSAPSGSQYANTQHISKAQAHSGDLVFWGSGGSEHVGVYAGGNKYYSAESPSTGIRMNTLDSVVGKGKPLFGRVKGLKQDTDEPKVKAKSGLEKKIKAQVGNGFWKTIDKIADKYGEHMADPAGDGVGRWKKTVIKALKANGFSASDFQVQSWLKVISRESNGNPHAINLWDSNAKAGIPTKGLGQITPPNFEKYKQNANSNIYNGYDNLYAAINYMKHTYGSSSAAFSRVAGGAYANGGFASQPSIFGEAGPEAAIPLIPTKSTRAWELVGKTIAILSAQSGLGSSVNSSEYQEQEKEDKQFKEKVLLLLEQLVGNNEVPVDVKLDINGKVIAEQISPFLRKINGNNLNRKRNGYA